METSESFGERLRRARHARRLTLRQLADLVAVDFTYLSKLENDRLPPPADLTIERLSEVLGVDSDDLYAVARKVPTGLRRKVKEAPPETAMLLRRLSTSHLTLEQYRQIMEILNEGPTDALDDGGNNDP